MKTKIFLTLFLSLLISGCIEEIDAINPKKLLEAGEITGASFGERHLITASTPKEILSGKHQTLEENCLKLGCEIVYSYLADNQKAYLKALIPNVNIDELLRESNLNVSQKSIVKGAVSAAADIQKRLEINETTFKNLINSPNNSNPLVVARELERLQSEIETLKMVLKVKDKTITLPKDREAEAKNAKMVLLDVNLETSKHLAGFNISLIENALSKSYQIFVTSASYVIVFLALALPWLPVAIIIMWLLAIVFKHKVKIRTITPVANRSSNSHHSSFGADPVITVEHKEQKKGFFGGLFAKKDKDEEEDI